MTEKQIVIESRLLHDWDFCKLCLLKLYEQQTDDEQDIGDTQHENGKGFNKADALELSKLAEFIKGGGTVNLGYAKQFAQQRMKKYAKQLTTLLTDEEIET